MASLSAKITGMATLRCQGRTYQPGVRASEDHADLPITTSITTRNDLCEPRQANSLPGADLEELSGTPSGMQNTSPLSLSISRTES